MAEGMPPPLPPKDPQPRVRWWHPTLLIAIVGAVPQYREWVMAFIYNLPFGTVKEAQEQLEAWSHNSPCLSDRNIDNIKPSSQTNYGIDLLPCPSGDILVTLTPYQNQPVSRWVITKNLFGQGGIQFRPQCWLRSLGLTRPIRCV
jgi:hypothetical protein